MPTNTKRLTRSSHDKMLGGVAAGIANYFDIDPALIRIAFILITLLGGSGVLAYIILWIVLPPEEGAVIEPDQQMKQNVEEIKSTASKIATKSQLDNSKPLWGFFLLGLGVIFLLQNFGFATWFNWSRLWPLILIVVGFVILSKK